MPIPIDTTIGYRTFVADTMVSLDHKIDTVDITVQDETETDRMWRQIDPTLYYTTKQVVDN